MGGSLGGSPQDVSPYSKLVVSRKMPSGDILEGSPGHNHSDLMDDDEIENVMENGPDPVGEFGYTIPGSGKFLTREEAYQSLVNSLNQSKSRPTQ